MFACYLLNMINSEFIRGIDTKKSADQLLCGSDTQLLLPGLLVLVSVAVQTELRIHTGVICDRNVISDLV